MTGAYDGTLVVLSVLVAALASYTALDLAGRVASSHGRAARGWLLAGAFAMGAGIWSMHFIGMLAFSLSETRLAYDLGLTLVSMLFAIVISGLALHLVSRQNLRPQHLLGGGVVMGIGICAMHYTGMAAMRMSPPIQYDPVLFAASVLIAISASMAALWLAFTLRAGETRTAVLLKVVSAMVMGFAIAGMHYTGMAAAQFAPGAMCLATGPGVLSGTSLAFSITIAIISILSITLLASAFDKRLARRTADMLRRVEETNRELQREVEQRTRIQESLRNTADALRQRSEELERSNRELEQFAYAASHDLQAPLRSVTGFAHLLQRHLGEQLDPTASEYLSFILDSTQQMRQLVQALLELARVGEAGLRLERTDLNEALTGARNALRSLISERDADLQAASLPVLYVDRTLMTQLLQNLINNAIKFQPRQPPQVRVVARQDDRAWVISVQDRGIGIAPDHFERVFRVFQRLHTQDQYEGSGVGLTICEKIVRLHGGRIWLDSVPGEGTTFHFTIPEPAAAVPA